MKQRLPSPTRLPFRVRGLVLILLTSAMTTGCEKKMRITRTIEPNQDLVFNINTTGNTDQEVVVYPSDLLNKLDVKGSNLRIEKFTLHSVSFEATKNAGNTADFFRLLSLEIKRPNLMGTYMDPPVEMLNLSKLPTQSVPIGNSTGFIINSLLSIDGVAGINKTFSDYLVGSVYSGGGVYRTRYVTFRLRGTNIPANTRLSVRLTMHLNATIEYSTCEQLPQFMFGGEEC